MSQEKISTKRILFIYKIKNTHYIIVKTRNLQIRKLYLRAFSGFSTHLVQRDQSFFISYLFVLTLFVYL